MVGSWEDRLLKTRYPTAFLGKPKWQSPQDVRIFARCSVELHRKFSLSWAINFQLTFCQVSSVIFQNAENRSHLVKHLNLLDQISFSLFFGKAYKSLTVTSTSCPQLQQKLISHPFYFNLSKPFARVFSEWTWLVKERFLCSTGSHTKTSWQNLKFLSDFLIGLPNFQYEITQFILQVIDL